MRVLLQQGRPWPRGHHGFGIGASTVKVEMAGTLSTLILSLPCLCQSASKLVKHTAHVRGLWYKTFQLFKMMRLGILGVA